MFSDAELRGVSSSHAAPLYHQLFLILRQKIEAGEIGFGKLLPSEIELASVFGLSRITSKRALDELAERGLVERQRGRGTLVIYRYEPKVLRAPLTSMLENLTVMGKETSVEVLDFCEVSASKEIAEALKIPLHTPVIQAVRIRRYQGEAFAYYVSHTIKLAPINGAEFSARALKSHARLELFKALGVQLSEVEQSLSACGADSAVAHALQVPIGAPLLSLTRIYIDRDQRPVDHLRGLYRPDRFQYHMRLSAQSQARMPGSGFSGALSVFPKDASTVPLPKDSSALPLPRDASSVPLSRDPSSVPLSRDSSSVPLSRDSSSVPLSRDSSSVPLSRDSSSAKNSTLGPDRR